MSANTLRTDPERISEAFLTHMWEALSPALKKVKASALPGNVGEFIPLSLSPVLADSGVFSKEGVPEPFKPLFEGLGKPYKYQSDLTDEKNFAKLDLAKEGGEFIASFRVHDYERTGGESYTAVDIVVYLDKDEALHAVPVVKKCIIAGGARVEGGLKETTRERAEKLRHLKEIGIPTIHLHGVDTETAVLYEGLYPDGKESIYKKMKVGDVEAIKLMPQLASIAKRLDENHYDSINFLSDLIFDGENFLYLDAGSDVGSSGGNKENPSLEVLIKAFPEQAELIRSLYEETDETNKLQVKTGLKVGSVITPEL